MKLKTKLITKVKKKKLKDKKNTELPFQSIHKVFS